MPFVDLDTVTVTGTYLMLDETPAAGTVTFEISDATVQGLQDAVGNQIIVPKVITVVLDNLGHFSVALPATDDPDVSPTGFTYRVTENIAGASGNRPRVYDIVVPEGSVGGTLDLADVAPVVTLPGLSSYVLFPTFNALEQRVADLETNGVPPGGLDPDIVVIGNLDATTAGTIASDGAGWIKKTYAGFKTALGIGTADVAGLTAALNAKAATASPALTGTPTAPDPTTPTGIANKQWTEAIASSSKSKAEVQYASLVPLSVANGANTYANGTAGVGATLTGNANGALVIDGVTLAAGQVNQDVLIGGEATASHNGWYTVTRVGTGGTSYQLTRRVADDQAAEIGPGYMTPVKGPAGFTPGTNNDNKVFLSSAPSPFVVGTDALTFTPMGGTYAAGNGVILVGAQFAIDPAITADLATAQTFINKTLTAPVLQNPTADTVKVTGLPGSGLGQVREVGRGQFGVAFTGTYEVGDKLTILGGLPYEFVCTTAGTVGVGAGPTFEVVGFELVLAQARADAADAIAAITDIAVDSSLTQTTAGGVMTIGSATPIISVTRTTDDRVVANNGAGQNPNWATVNIVPVGDAVLKLPVAANSTYRFWLYVIYNMPTNAGGRFTFTKPAASTLFWTPGGVGGAVQTTAGVITKQSVGAGTNAQVGGAGGPEVATLEGHLRTAATAGFLEFLAAHWTAQPLDGWILTGSQFVLMKVA